MKTAYLSFMLTCFAFNTYAQKLTLDYFAINQWPRIDDYKLSNNGKYLAFTICSKVAGCRLIMQSSDNSWRKEIQGLDNVLITENNKFAIYKSRDTIGIIELGTDSVQLVSHVQSFKTSFSNGSQFIAYQLDNDQNKFVLDNLSAGKLYLFEFVKDYQFSSAGNRLVLLTEDKSRISIKRSVVWIDLANMSKSTILEDVQNISNLVFDNSGKQLAFVTSDSANPINNRLMYFNNTMFQAMPMAITGFAELGTTYYITKNAPGFPAFSVDGSRIFISLKRVKDSSIKMSVSSEAVEIWNYDDPLLHPQQLSKIKNGEDFSVLTAVVNLKLDHKVTILQRENESCIDLPQNADNHFALIASLTGNINEGFWNSSGRPSFYLVSEYNGSRKLIINHLLSTNIFQARCSPNGSYVTWFDLESKKYFTYCVKTSKTSQIGKTIPFRLYDDGNGNHIKQPYGIVGWLNDESALYIYDQYDIWKVDPAGNKQSVNITSYFGRKNKIVLRYYEEKINSTDPSLFHLDKSLLLCGQSDLDEEAGFFKLQINNLNSFCKLTMTSSIFSWPQKAKDTSLYILTIMNALHFPNIYTTTDFETFDQRTFLSPQSKVNWYSTELVHWKMFDGKQSKGILYKPENFNPKKKYPIIFYFYEQDADHLNDYTYPDLSQGELNIPWFVSHGYLVFDPDISYKEGYPGKGAFNSVVSAAKFLANKPWVDSTRMGIQGHSFGGYEVNYLVTHTNIFKAAVSAAGVCNFTSLYGSLFGDESFEFIFESGQNRIGRTLWQNPNLYIINSPIFYASRITTPLLIMHNKNDTRVPWSQDVEWFTGLRRLNKKVWMLQYDKEAHSLSDEQNQLDYTTKLAQFFDHYLKGASAPEWMTVRIPAEYKKN